MMNKIQALRNKKGFTLVELIVVIVIIAILAAVSVPLLTKYIGDAKDSNVDSAQSIVYSASQTAAASVSAGLGSAAASFQAELDSLLDDKYTVGTATATSCVVTTNPAGITITITGTDLTGKTPVVTDVTAAKDK
ncbi:MAG: prepilin-type N-terminal cleavage/methylation domain-containing protein [Clostridiales bacterium]